MTADCCAANGLHYDRGLQVDVDVVAGPRGVFDLGELRAVFRGPGRVDPCDGPVVRGARATRSVVLVKGRCPRFFGKLRDDANAQVSGRAVV
jgi:hypothetical protein